MNIKFRPATTQDCPDILATQQAAIRGLCVGDYTPDQIQGWSAALCEEDLMSGIGANVSAVAVDDSGVVGFGELDVKQAAVVGIYVQPQHARLGLGTMLFQAMENRARSAGVRQLSVVSTITAVPFFARLGFVAEPAETRAMAGGVEIPVIPMRRSF